MAKKRERLEVIYDILKAIRDNSNSIGPTRLLYASNLSPQMFKEYTSELLEKGFIILDEGKKSTYSLDDKGFKFLERYSIVQDFIENMGL